VKPVRAHPGRRLALCSVVVVLVFGVLAFRVTQLQVLSGNRYRLASLRQTVHTVPIPAQRGTIFDRDGRDLAMSIELSSVYADPQEVLDPIAYASELSPILDVSPQLLQSRLSDKHFQFEYLARRVSDSVVAQVRKLGLVGVGFVPESAREYPAGPLASSLIGEVGGAGTGLSGLEALYQPILAGKAGELVVERDQQGLDIPNTATHSVEARRGTDIVLTLDEPLQYETEQALIDEVTATQAQGGMAAIVNVTNGDVLAMASIDGASGKLPARPSGPTEQTRPLMDLFEPGSTNKLITLSTAIENGLVTPDTVIDVPPELRVGDAEFTDVDPHGDVKMTVADILQQSSNIGTIEIAQRMSKDTLANALHSFGLGAPTSVAFPGQAAGLLLDPSHYYDTGLASTAIGYGVAVTGMQMLDAYVTIANGGVTRPPHLLDAEIDAKGVRHPAHVAAGHRVVSTATSTEMTGMLEGVVSSGTGACASIPGYTVAGKTGTARKAVNGGYSASTMASFIGYAPALHPKLAAIVVLDAPNTEFGGAAAAPVFSDIMQFALTRNEVAPDDVDNTQYNAARAAAATSGTACTPPAAAAAAERAAEAAAAHAAAEAAAQSAALIPPGAREKLSSAGARAPSGAAAGDSGSAGSGSGSGSGSGPAGTSGAPSAPGTLPGDTSKSG
jgi:cell division protein FtsI (penicillin-binding protein 3)